MDDFFEVNYSEDSNGFDNASAGEAEAALYSMVHHTGDTYGTDGTATFEFGSNYTENRRNRASRWESFKRIESVEPIGFVPQRNENLQAHDYVPFDKGEPVGTPRHSPSKLHNRRNWIQKRRGHRQETDRPWKHHSEVRNPYLRNGYTPPSLVHCDNIALNNSAEAQHLLCVNGNISRNIPTLGGNLKELLKSTVPSRTVQHSDENTSSTSGYNSLNNFQSETVAFTLENERNFACGAFQRENTIENGVSEDSTHRTLMVSNASNRGIKIISESTRGYSNVNEVTGNVSTSIKERKKPHMDSRICLVNKVAKCVSTNNEESVNTKNLQEILIISDSDQDKDATDSESSVIEVTVPPKPEPPVIALDSSDEAESLVVSKEKLTLNITMSNSDKSSVVVTEGTFNSSNKSTSFTGSHCRRVQPSSHLAETTGKVKKKKKKSKKKNSTKIVECSSWTAGMIKFYNRSWGGETFDHVKVQQKMSSSPSKWKILDVDRYGPMSYGPLGRIRCANCNQRGHIVRDCPDPKKIKSCAMCGIRGHGELYCPNKMCLKCGRPAPMFNNGCPQCWNQVQKICTTCGENDHDNWLCPNIWRKFHSVTTTEEVSVVNSQTVRYKSSADLACCLCAERGHTASQCRSVPGQSKSLPNSPVTNNAHTGGSPRFRKRKKRKSNFHFDERNQQEFNTKRRRTQ